MRTVTDQAKALQDEIFACARTIRERGEEVEPMGFVLVPADDGLGVIQVPMNRFPSKDAAAAALKALCERVGGMFVVHVIEAWTVLGDESHAANAFVQAGGALQDFPGATEHIFAMMDGAGIQRVLLAEVKKDGTLGETEDRTPRAMTGRFTNLSGQLGAN